MCTALVAFMAPNGAAKGYDLSISQGTMLMAAVRRQAPPIAAGAFTAVVSQTHCS